MPNADTTLSSALTHIRSAVGKVSAAAAAPAPTNVKVVETADSLLIREAKTYTTEPTDTDFAHFTVDEESVAAALAHPTVSAYYQQLVPTALSRETFFRRLLFRRQQLIQQENKRADLLRRLQSDTTRLDDWDDDDDRKDVASAETADTSAAVTSSDAAAPAVSVRGDDEWSEWE